MTFNPSFASTGPSFETGAPTHRARGRAHGAVLASFGLALLVAGCQGPDAPTPTASAPRPPVNEAHQVTFLADTNRLAPSSTFEVRFDERMVAPRDVGITLDPPLTFAPPLPGTFVWTSPRSGVFAPSEGLPLGTEFHIGLRPGLTNATGQASAARLITRVRTPGLRVDRREPESFPIDNAPAQPALDLQFNTAVDPAAVAQFASFQADDESRIASVARHATGEDALPRGYSYSPSFLPWEARFGRASDSEYEPPIEPLAATQTVAHCVVITPAEPLATGRRWTFELKAGLNARSGAAQLATNVVVEIGTVVPMEVAQIHAENRLRELPRLDVTFNKTLLGVDPTNATRWVTIEPAISNLSAAVSWNTISFTGPFEVGRDYDVTVQAGVPAVEQFALPAEHRARVRFQPLLTRLYFPDFSTHQLQTGRRNFTLGSVNAPAITVRAKRIPPETLVYALNGFQHYNRPQDGTADPAEPFREVPFDLVAGPVIFESQLVTGSAIDQWHELPLDWDVLLGRNEPGAVFVEAATSGNGRRLGVQSIVQLTDIGLFWKRSSQTMQVFAFSMQSGQPLEGVQLKLVSGDNRPLGMARTQADGLANLTVNDVDPWLVAEWGRDVRALRVNGGATELPLWNLGMPLAWDEPPAERLQAHVFSDRRLYQPGETAHFKGIVRQFRGNQIALPGDQEVAVRVTDPRGALLLEDAVVLSSSGSFDVSVDLPEGRLGWYSAVFQVGTEESYLGFEVQHYVPQAFELTLSAPATLHTTNAAVSIAARYFHGKPVADGPVKWSISAYDTGFSHEGFNGYTFCSTLYHLDEAWRPGSFDWRGDAVLNDAGEWALVPGVAAHPLSPQPRLINIAAEVTDATQQTVSRATTTTFHPSAFYLGLKGADAVNAAGQPIPWTVVAVGSDGVPWTNAVTAELAAYRLNWRTERIEGAGGSITLRQVPLFEPVWRALTDVAPARRFGDRFLADASSAAFTPQDPGTYVIEARAIDPSGAPVITRDQFEVAGEGEARWSWSNASQMDLVPHHSLYRVGEEAQILVKAPFPGLALVSIEGPGLRKTSLIPLQGDAQTLPILIEPGMEPNIFVSVILVRGAKDSPRRLKEPDFRYGYCELKIAHDRARLTVDLAPSQSDYQPRDPVEIVATVRDHRGVPVGGAEVTLFAVDEGVLALAPFDLENPFDLFHAPRRLAVRSFATLPSLFPEDPAHHRFENKGFVVGDGGDAESTLVREFFDPVPLWQPVMLSDARGQVRAKCEAPDSLTRFKVMAVAHTRRHQFGTGQSTFRVNKPLMIQPSVPRLAHVGDEIQARAVLHNLTDAPGRATLTLTLDATARPAGGDATPDQSPLVREIDLPARATRAIDIPVQCSAPGRARWVWRGSFTSAGLQNETFEDAVASELPIAIPIPLQSETHVTELRTNHLDLLSAINPALLAGDGKVTVRVANSPLSALGSSAHFLLNYPYGCLEQRISATIPWIVASDPVVPRALPLLDRPAPEIADTVAHTIDALLPHQGMRGGLSYWPGHDEPEVWLNAYALLALVSAEAAGHFVPEHLTGGIVRFLKEALRTPAPPRDEFELAAHCLAAWALAEAHQPEPATHEHLLGLLPQLSQEARAWLALALVHSGGDLDAAQRLLSASPAESVEQSGPFGSPLRARAVELLARCAVTPRDAALPRLALEVGSSPALGARGTTQDNAWALLALQRYAALFPEAAPVRGEIAGASAPQRFALAAGPSSAEIEIPFASGTSEPALTLRLPDAPQGAAFVSVTVESRPPGTPARQDRGIGLERRFVAVDERGQRKANLDTLRVGDPVLVELDLDVRAPSHFLVIDDALPAVLAAVNPAFEQSSSGTAEAGLSAEGFADHVEMKVGRTLIFRDHLAPGRYRFAYLARVIASGAVVAPPCKAEEMYAPDRFALTPPGRLVTKPL